MCGGVICNLNYYSSETLKSILIRWSLSAAYCSYLHCGERHVQHDVYTRDHADIDGYSPRRHRIQLHDELYHGAGECNLAAPTTLMLLEKLFNELR